MQVKRRELMKILPLGALLPWQLLSAFTDTKSLSDPSISKQDQDIDKIFSQAIVFDGLLIPRGWNEASFKALAKSGYTGFNASLVSRNLKLALDSMAEWTKRIEDNPDKLLHAKTADDFVLAKKEKKVAVMYGFQNATMVENSVDNVDVLYKAGTRWIQLTYNQRNLLGDGCTERTNAGLSDFGIDVVDRMNELGIVVDLSHSGRQTTNDAIAFSKSGVSFNHTMCEALYKNHPRAKTDEQIRAMADKGGMMGIICLGYMIGPDPGGATTLETYVDHIEHAIKVGGIDHVGVATDFAIEGLEANGATRENWYVPRLTRFKPSYQVRWPPWIPELDTPERYKYVARLLNKRGHSTTDIEKILGGNWLRYFRETLKS
ncbi:MAG: membrane dipeptidase [Nonlabens sp.]|jgi:membrane dipeptidase